MVSRLRVTVASGSGRLAPARFAWGLLAAAMPLPGFAQPLPQPPPAPPPAPPVSNVPVPGEMELNKLVWSTMAAVDHANLAGNYSVLRDLAAPGFQLNNDAARLAQIFAALRASRIDLSNTLLLGPSYTAAPRRPAADMLRIQGFFGLRPTAIRFDLQYQWAGGRWRLFGVDIQPATLSAAQPAPVAKPVPGKKN